MKRSKLWSASITMIVIIVMISAYSIIGPVFGHESEKPEGAGEQRTESNEGGRATRHEGAGEHSAGEGGDESAGEPGCEIDNAAERAGEKTWALDESYDAPHYGARWILSYDAAGNRFVGTVKNTTNAVLMGVRVHIHLSNGADLGPTAPTDLAAGEILDIVLDATDQPFDSWTPHVVTDDAGEYGDPSSPILALGESWDGVVNGVRTSMSYDPQRGAFTGFVENPGDQVLRVQIELNLKQGSATVVELGPYPVGDLAPGEQAAVELLIADEPLAADVSFDAWEIHPEVLNCGEPGTVASEDARESADSNSDEAERFGKYALALEEVYDVTHNGARLVMRYDEANNRFVGTVENTTEVTLTRARVEIHLSNGVELGPTTPADLAAGEVLDIELEARSQAFDAWTPHAEVGMGEGRGEHSGREGRGEHGSREGRGEHGDS